MVYRISKQRPVVFGLPWSECLIVYALSDFQVIKPLVALADQAKARI